MSEKPKIMIVDDAAYMRAVLEEVLIKNGFDVVAKAKNGLEGVNIYEELYEIGKAPDLVLLDITMRKMNGLEALKEMMKIDKGVNVVMCSAIKQKEALVEAVNEGAKYFIVKPFEDEELVETIKKALKR